MKAVARLPKELRATALRRRARAKGADNEPLAFVSPSIEPRNSQPISFDYRQSFLKPASKKWLKMRRLVRNCEMRSDKTRTHVCIVAEFVLHPYMRCCACATTARLEL